MSSESIPFYKHHKVANPTSLYAAVPACIPEHGKKAYILASDEDREAMEKSAMELSYIEIGRIPELRSEGIRRAAKNAGQLFCMCETLGYCPTVPIQDVHKQFRNVENGVKQFFPQDQCWWELRDIANELRGQFGSAAH